MQALMARAAWPAVQDLMFMCQHLSQATAVLWGLLQHQPGLSWTQSVQVVLGVRLVCCGGV